MFFPPHKSSALKKEISNFKAVKDEKFFCLLGKVQGDSPPWPLTIGLVSYFYGGRMPSMKKLLETMCGGNFIT